MNNENNQIQLGEELVSTIVKISIERDIRRPPEDLEMLAIIESQDRLREFISEHQNAAEASLAFLNQCCQYSKSDYDALIAGEIAKIAESMRKHEEMVEIVAQHEKALSVTPCFFRPDKTTEFTQYGRMQVLLLRQADGYLDDNALAVKWIAEFSNYVKESVGMNPTIRIGAYLHGVGNTFFPMDVIRSGDENPSIAITIGFSQNTVILPKQFDDQMDLALPGIIDTFKILSSITEATHGQVKVTSGFY